MKSVLFVSRHAPYGSSLAKDALDALLTSAAYDQPLAMLFMDDGVFQLLPGQDANLIGQKSFSRMLPALELYGVERLFVHQPSLELRNLGLEDLMTLPLSLVNDDELRNLLQNHQHILSF